MLYLSRFRSGFLIGFGSGFVTRDVLSNGPSLFRPVIKSTIKAVLAVASKTQESIYMLVENAEDLFAEIRSERLTQTRRPSDSGRARPSGVEEELKTKSRAHKAKGAHL